MSDGIEGVVSVAIVPEYCGQCGAALDERPFEGEPRPWCPDCGLVFAKGPVPGVQVLVHDETGVLLVAEPHVEDTLWNFPGGHADPGEGPREAALRELREETGVTAAAADLSLFDVVHGSFERTDYYVVTYSLPRAAADGDPEPAAEMDGARYWEPADVLAAPDRTRESDREHVRALFDVA